MNHIFSIYRHDLKNLTKNWVALLVVVVLALLPSLYAWFNIYAGMDPYGNTGNLKVGVAILDEGATALDKEVNAGEELRKQLLENESLNFVMVDEDEANQGVEEGRYFAAIIVPRNFSERLVSILGPNPQKAELTYKVNEKMNAIAPKITNQGAETIKNKVSDAFVEMADGAIFEVFNQLGLKVSENQDDIRKYEDLLFGLEQNMPRILNIVTEANNSLDSVNHYVEIAHEKFPQLELMVTDSLGLLDRLDPVMDKIAAAFEAIPEAIRGNMSMMLTSLYGINSQLLADLQGENLQRDLTDIQQKLQVADQALGTLESLFSTLNGFLGNNLSGQVSELDHLRGRLNEASSLAGTAASIPELQDMIEGILTDVNRFIDEYGNVTVDDLVGHFQGAKGKLALARTALTEVQNAMPELKGALDKIDEAMPIVNEELPRIAGLMPEMAADVTKAANELRAFHSEYDVDSILDLLETDSATASDFFREPVVINTVRLFEVANYGTAMTPFYTTLSLWVGGLLLVSLFTTGSKTFAPIASPRQIYFGKWLTFMTIGMVQGLICAVGDLTILGISAQHPFAFVVTSVFTSLVFVTLIFSLVSVFGAAGKVLGILLLVLQVAGSGGTFPMELLPRFYQVIQPLMPFRYSLALSREFIAGANQAVVRQNLWFLFFYFVGCIVIAPLVKPFVNQVSDVFDEKLHHSSLIE